MKKRTIYIGLFLIFIIGVISLIGTFAIDSSITEGNSSKADYLFNITLGDRTNRDIVIPSYDSKIVDIKISNPNDFNMSYLLYLEGTNSSISIINISDTEVSGILNSKTTNLIKVFIQNNSSTDITVSIKDIVGFEKETLDLPSNGTAIAKGNYFKAIVKSNNNDYGKVKPNIKLSTKNGTIKYTLVPNDGYEYKSTTCDGTVSNNILTISNITSNISCEVLFESKKVQVSFDAAGGSYNISSTYTEPKEYTYTAPYTGLYKIEAWGAQGGQPTYNIGSYGGYTSGNIYLNENEILYLYIGQKGADSCIPYTSCNGTAFNGGASGGYFTYVDYNERNAGGGGATDIRLISGNWDDADSLASRIMVAGAGSGSESKNKTVKGYAGGLIGYSGYAGTASNIIKATGGTQTSGGTGKNEGSFGKGGNGYVLYPNNPNNNVASGAGSGYYGGGGGQSGTYTSTNMAGDSEGGGGSSYISGHTGCVAITSQSNITPKSDCTTGTTDNNCSIHYSGKKFTNTVMIDGQGYTWTNTKGELQQMPKPSGGYYDSGVGHSGDGAVRITVMDDITLNIEYNDKYSDLPTPTKDGYIFGGWYTEPDGEGTLITNSSKVLNTKNHTLYAYWLPQTEYNYDSPGSYTYTIPRTGIYKLETWGAQGGGTGSYVGGYGAYATGNIVLKNGQVLYISVGGKGSLNFSTGTSAVAITGGYNGGGTGTRGGDGNYSVSGGSGGGATHIATNSGLLSTLSGNEDSILIVSSGGGGAGVNNYNLSAFAHAGGSGGGIIGNSATGESGTCTPGSQTAGSKFGAGGNYTTLTHGAAGGGGGYYGGTGGGVNSPGCGGSSYIGNSLLTNKYMYCYNCTTSNEYSTKTYTTTNVSDVPTSDYAKKNDGAVRITFLGLDVEAPTGKMSTNVEDDSINISVDATDNIGVDHYEYYLSTGATCPTDGYTTVYSNTFSIKAKSTGTYYACIKAVDGSNNSLLIKSNAIEISVIKYTTLGDYTFTVLKDGLYKLEAWGAQGGGTGSYVGGYGAYATGNIVLKNGQVLYISVGGKGNLSLSAGSSTVVITGGYNGGGNGTRGGDGDYSVSGGSGGGATHIATKSGLLSTLSGSEDSILIVSSGGGGAGVNSFNLSAFAHAGGHGGGIIGNSASGESGTCTPGSQTTGSKFGAGGNYTTLTHGAAGGGGGYYGGTGGGVNSPGCGGSSYIGNSLLTEKYMYCYNCTESSVESTKTISTTSHSNTPTENYAKEGDGAVRITFLN